MNYMHNNNGEIMETRTFVSKQKKVIPVEVYSRVVGYFRPTNQWNPGKKAEFDEREFYNVNDLYKAKSFV